MYTWLDMAGYKDKTVPKRHGSRARIAFLGSVAIATAVWTGVSFVRASHWEAWPPHTEQPVVALTFDDGPNPVYTPQILQILREHDAKATFFMVGTNVARHPEIARLIVREGHEVGNHSMNHQYRLPYLLPWQIRKEYLRSQGVILRETGVSPLLFRAPHGRLSPWMALTLRRGGATIIGWDIDPRDLSNTAPEALVRKVLDQVRPGSIILLHDGLDVHENVNRQVLVQSLPQLIEQLQARGYCLATLSDLLRGDLKNDCKTTQPIPPSAALKLRE